MTTASLLDRAIPLPIPLAKLLGRSTALFLQQLHFHLRFDAQQIDGEAWYTELYKNWAEELGLSIATLKRIVSQLQALKLIVVGKFHGYVRKNSYRIDYDKLQTFIAKGSNLALSEAQNEPQINYSNSFQTTTVVVPEAVDPDPTPQPADPPIDSAIPTHPRSAQNKPIVQDKSSATLDSPVEKFLEQLGKILAGSPSEKLTQIAVRSFRRDAQAAGNVLAEFVRQRQWIEEPIAWLVDGFINGREVVRSPEPLLEEFKVWYKWAYSQKLIIGSYEINGIRYVQTPDDRSLPWQEFALQHQPTGG